MSNGLASADAKVVRGNERVLSARLADAEFFLTVDRKCPSDQRREALNRVTFAKDLGSLRDRSDRISWLIDYLIQSLPIPSDTATHAQRAAYFCKHDLVSQMVGEFPELQGVMGAKYLLEEGEDRQVALAVAEHYQPRGSGDSLPSSAAGALLALADRLELLLSIYAKVTGLAVHPIPMPCVVLGTASFRSSGIVAGAFLCRPCSVMQRVIGRNFFLPLMWMLTSWSQISRCCCASEWFLSLKKMVFPLIWFNLLLGNP